MQFPPTSQSALIGGYKDRCDGLIQFHYLPVVAISAIELMSVSRGPQIERFLSQSQNFMFGVDFKPENMLELESSQDEAYCSFTRVRRVNFVFLIVVYMKHLLLFCHMLIFY